LGSFQVCVPWVFLAASPQYSEAWQVLRHNPVEYFQGHGPLNVGSFGYWRLLEASKPFLTTEGTEGLGGLPLYFQASELKLRRCPLL
jgi:hypothetical protein